MRVLLLAANLFCFNYTLYSRSWDDLYEPRYNFYGKEREEKFPIRAFVVEKESWSEHESLEIFWIYRSVDYPKYSSLRLLPLFHRVESKIDNRRLFISWWYYSRRDGSETDRAWFWLFYHGDNIEADSRYHGVIPLWYFFRQADHYRKLVTPLQYYEQSGGDGSAFTFWFPLLPLLYYQKQPDSLHGNIFGLIDFKTSSAGTRNFFLPLWYYHNYSEKKLLSLLPPVFWFWSSPDSSRGFLLLPFMLRYQAENRQGFISPLYLKVTSQQIAETSQLTIFLPLYLQYKSPQYRLHVNALGISLSEEQILVVPSLVHNEQKISVDWDIGWLWYLFRLSGRNTILQRDITENSRNVLLSEPELQKEKSLSRKNSNTFFGVYTFFGLSAYERSDNLRHFRLLPLSWLTWDAKSDNKLQIIAPVYLNYRSENLRYFVLVPFYGVQEKFTAQGSARLDAWLLNLYVRDEDPATDRRERSILWPFFHWYHTSRETGFRIFPLVWHKIRQETGQVLGYSPLYYYNLHSGGYDFISVVGYASSSPLEKTYGLWGIYHRRKNLNGNFENLWLLPIYWLRREELHSDGSVQTIQKINLLPLIFTTTSRDSKNWFFAGYWLQRAPGYSFDSLAGLVSLENRRDVQQQEIGLFFYAINYRYQPEEHYASLFWHLGGYWSQNQDDFAVSLLTFAGYETTMRRDGSSLIHHRLLPLWWYTAKADKREWIFPWLLGYVSYDSHSLNRLDLFGLGLLYYRKRETEQENDNLQILSGALYSFRQQQERRYRSYGSLWTLLWHYESEEGYNRFTILKFLLSRTEKDGLTQWRLLGIRL